MSTPWLILCGISFACVVGGLVTALLRLDDYNKKVGPWERFSRSFGTIKEDKTNLIDLDSARIAKVYRDALKKAAKGEGK